MTQSVREILCWPGDNSCGNFAIATVAQLQAGFDANGRKALALVKNPFGHALEQGVDLNALVAADPVAGEAKIDEYEAATRAECALAIGAGVDGVLYLIHGANPKHSSPMQFGGLYLERDREILTELAGGVQTVMIFVVGDEETYLECTTDLPATALGWDCHSTNFSIEQMRKFRSGHLLAASDTAEIELRTGLVHQTPAEFLEGQLSHV